MTETEAKSIHTLVRELQSLVKNAQEKWGLNFPRQGQGDKGDKLQTNTAIANDVHPFGPVNLNELFQEIPQKITLMREIISQFKNNILTGTSQPQYSEQTLKNYIIQLKEETERLDSLAEVKDSIKICKSLALDACQDNSTTFKFILQQIENLGKQLGLHVLNLEVLSMSGFIIVLDIKYDETSNRIIKVVVSYATDVRQNDKDDRLDNLLTQQLSDFKNFNLFKKNLETLTLLESMSKSIQPVDCFHYIKCISNDIKAIYEKELAATLENVPKILTEGHGIPLFHVERIGPSIAYWAPKLKIMEMEWEIIKDIVIQGETHESFKSLHRMWISMEKSRTAHLFLPPDRNRYLFDDETDNEIELLENYFLSPEMQFSLLPAPLKFLQPNPKQNESSVMFVSAPIEFVVWLDPPVYVSDEVARAIGTFLGIVNRGYFVSSAFQKKDPQALSLEQLLIEDIVPPVTQSSTSRAPKIIHQWEKTFDDSPYYQVFNLDSTCNTNARRIDRIPFSNLCQVYGFIKILRQQLVFNALYQSCFNSSTYKQIKITGASKHGQVLEETSPDTEAKVQIKVQTNNPPNGLSLNIQLPSDMTTSQTTIHLNITISQGIKQEEMWVLVEGPFITVTSHITGLGDTSKFNLNDTELTGVLKTCQDIPMLINHLLNNLFNPSNELVINLGEIEGINLDIMEENKMVVGETIDPDMIEGDKMAGIEGIEPYSYLYS